MGKYVGSSCRLCRREGEKLFLKGSRCYTHRCAIERRAFAPGQHGANKKTKLSNYGLQLREKQKLKRIYGLMEEQFRNYFAQAVGTKGVTGTVLLQILERRLDNVVYQSGFCSSRRQARQYVNHGYALVNDRRVDIPSYLVKENDEIEIKFTNQGRGQKTIKANIEENKNRAVPEWLEADTNHFKVKVKRLPERTDIGYPIKEQLIIELYSR